MGSISTVEAANSGVTGSADGANDTVQLGDFESGLDGWRTDGGNDLSRVSEDELPVGVTSGERALNVEVNGDLYPAIKKNVAPEDISFADYQFLRAHVTPIVEDSDSDLLFQFRLRYEPGGGNGNGGGGGKGNGKGKGKGKKARGGRPNVVESGFTNVLQGTSSVIQWDMGEIGEDVLSSVKRVEIAWYPEDHEPKKGPRGKNKGGFDYQGLTLVDNVRLFESDPETVREKRTRKKMKLHRQHGMVTERDIEERTADIERGTFVYADGTEIEYEYESLDSGGYRYTIDDETFVYRGDADE